MKTMSDYTLFCTPDQTRKALELGAPIDFSSNYYDGFDPIGYSEKYKDKIYAEIPTAEQMLGFFRSKNIHIVIQKDIVDNWSVYGHEISPIEFTVFDRLTGYKSYEEAALAAIDAALEYLISKKK